MTNVQTNTNQIKRQSSFTERFDCEIKKQRSKPCLALKDSITSIEDFSNEILYEIFDYLDGYDIYHAFSNLNIRFEQLITSSSLLFKLKFSRQSSSEIENCCKHFVIPNRHRIISFKFWNFLVTNEFRKQCIIDSSFACLQSITFYGILSDTLTAFLFYLNSLPRLSSLTIVLDRDYDYYDLTEIYRMIFQLQSLKYNSLVLPEGTEQTALVPFAINERFSTLEYLNMNHKCTLNELISILYHTPRLRRLSCGELLESEENMNNEVVLTLPDLTCIRVGQSFIQFDEFERFMQNIGGQLKVLDIWKFFNANYIDPDRWKQLISQHIPHLLEFRITCFIDVDDHFKNRCFDTFRKQFSSQFWIDHGWVLGLEFNSGKIFYSIKSNRELWCKLDENVDIITYSNQNSCDDLAPHIICSTSQNIGKSYTQSFQTIELSVWDHNYLASNISIIDKLNHILVALQINSLYVCFLDAPISTFLTLIHLLPNLDSLRVTILPLLELSKLSTEDTESLRLVSNNNKITKVWSPNKFEYAEFLIALCPRIEYLKMIWMMKTDLERIVRFVLMKTVTCIPHLHSLRLNVRNGHNEMIHRLQKMIDFEKLRTDYTIKHSSGDIILQLKSE